MSDAFWIAFMSAIALLAGHLVTQIFAFRLRTKEFRVQQIQKWIDSLESAEFKGQEPAPKGELETNLDYFAKALEKFATEATADIWSLYVRHKQIMTSEARTNFEPVLAVSRKAVSNYLTKDFGAKVFDGQKDQSIGDRISSASHVGKLLSAYEEMRAASIDSLYIQLRREVGVKP